MGSANLQGCGPAARPTAKAHLQPADTTLDGIRKRHRAVPGQLVGIAHILHQLGFDLGDFPQRAGGSTFARRSSSGLACARTSAIRAVSHPIANHAAGLASIYN